MHKSWVKQWIKHTRDFSFLSFLFPALFIYTLIVTYPVISSFFYSLTNWDGFSREWNFIWFENYKRALHDTMLISSVKNTLVYAFFTTLLLNVVGLALAIILDGKELFFKGFRIVFLVPLVLSTMVVSYLWSYILHSDLGVLNIFLRSVGLDMLALDWLGNPHIAMYTIIVVAIWQGVGYQFSIYLANLQGIPKELYEAAKIDGAGQWNNFRYVTIPMLAPAFTVNILLAAIGGFKVFDIVFIMTNGGPGYATEVLSTAMYRVAFRANDAGYGTAISVIMFVFTLLISLVLLKMLRSREVEA